MKFDIFIRLRHFFFRLKSKPNYNKFLTFLFFVILSTIFWLLTTLNKNYTTKLKYPVRYINFPRNKVLITELPDKLTLEVNSDGYNLIKYKLKIRKPPIVFDVNSFSLNRLAEKGPNVFYTLTKYAKSKIEKQLNPDIKTIEEIYPDSLIFRFANIVRKKVPVIADLKLNFEQPYMQKGPLILNPDSIIINGPQNIIDTITFVKTRIHELKNINEPDKIIVFLKKIELVSFSEKKIQIQINTEKYTENELSIPITVINVPDTLSLKTFPGKVNISYKIGLSDYEKITPDMFLAVVDYNMIKKDVSRIQVVLDTFPDYIKSLKVHPPSVEFLIEK